MLCISHQDIYTQTWFAMYIYNVSTRNLAEFAEYVNFYVSSSLAKFFEPHRFS